MLLMAFYKVKRPLQVGKTHPKSLSKTILLGKKSPFFTLQRPFYTQNSTISIPPKAILSTLQLSFIKTKSIHPMP